ncbi:hypothetical protein ACIHDR_03450 [Nocardia sp. NPDC052278]|jgi:hypothetical protein|uniref:hypothetical protein n=1 Tax=unclassified Nocardia TaxID=2637762 RepID=UPI00369DDFE7
MSEGVTWRDRLAQAAMLAILGGALLFVLGSCDHGKNPTCGGQTMHQGDRCVRESDHSSTSYQDRRSAQDQLPIVGGVMIAAGAATLVWWQVTRKKNAAD